METEYIVFIANLVLSAAVAAGTAVYVIGQYKAKVDRVITDQEKCDTKRTEMKTELDKLLEFKVSTQKFIDSKLYTAQSPLNLSDFGTKLIKESGFLDIFETVKDDLVLKLEVLKPSTQYETQEKSRALMDELTEYVPFRPIAKYAFDHGIDLSQILRAGAILLRDYYFEKHPEVVNPKEQW
jgi:hypothetical protein